MSMVRVPHLCVLGFALFLMATWPAGVQADVALGDIVGGGDGTGTAPPENIGISADDGLFKQAHDNRDITDIDGENPKIIDDEVSPYIDSVFIMNSNPMAINSAGVTFEFAAGDENGSTWNHILKDRTHDVDKGLNDIYLSGVTYVGGMGIHASAGITFDLDAMRSTLPNPNEEMIFLAVAGIDRCAGSVNNYIFFSNDDEIIQEPAPFMGLFTGNRGEMVELPVPLDAKYVTLATGDAGNGIGCDHGVFGEVRLATQVLLRRTIPPVSAGQTGTISIDVSRISEVNALEIREVIPRGFIASSPSDGGVIEDSPGPGRQTIVWTFTGGVPDLTLTYDIEVPSPFPNSSFTRSTATADGRRKVILGDVAFRGGSDGFQSEALVVTLQQPVAACGEGDDPGNAAMRRDFLTDGDAISEVTIAPAVGESISPDFRGESPSPGPASPTGLTWTRMTGAGWFQLNVCDGCMSYVAFYVENPGPNTVQVVIGSASDDSQQILLDGKEVWINNIARGAGSPRVQDRTTPIDLTPGKHLVMQKVFEGCGGFDSAIRFEDEDQNPFLLPTSLDPAGYPVGTAFVMRDIPDSLDVGETGRITLKLRIKEPTVGAVIEEDVPAVFTITDPGTAERSGQKLKWTIAGDLASRDLSYQISIPEGSLDGTFTGTAVLGGDPTVILGDQAFSRGVMTGTGFIKHWLVFGPLDTFGIWTGDPIDPNLDANAPSATPENGDLRADFLANASFTEETIRPFDGMRHDPAFQGLSRAQAFEPLSLKSCAPATPTWEAFISPTGTFNNDEYFGEAIESHTTYAACYVTNTTGQNIEATVAINSDDAFIAFLDGVDVVAYEPGPCSATACGRGYGAEDSIMETGPVTITPGEHFLLTRVHDGFGGSGHRLRFQDAEGNPILPPDLKVSLKPSAPQAPAYVRRILSTDAYRLPTTPTVTLRIESDGNHQVNIREVLPAGWAAIDISHNGSEAAGVVTWSVAATAGTTDVTYRLASGDCPGGGSFCGNGVDGSSYTVDGTTHSLNGDRSFRRETKGTDDLGAWTVTDIATSGGGTQRVGDRGADVTGKGAGIRQTKDEFRFVSVPRSGDFEISARLECMDDPTGTGRGGLMVRDTFDTFSAHAFLALGLNAPGSPSVGTLSGVTRLETKKTKISSTIIIQDKDVPALPVYLKLRRAGTKLTLHRSADGNTYTELVSRDIGTGLNQIQLKTDTLVGLAVTGGARIDFRDVRGVPDLPTFTPARPDRPTLTNATGGTRQVVLTWTAPASGPTPSSYVVRRAEAIGGPYIRVTDTAVGTSYTDTGLLDNKEYCYQVRSKLGTQESDDSNTMCARTTGTQQPTFRRGNVNGDTLLDISDAIGILGYLFLGQADKVVCVDAADIKDKGSIDISDAISVLNFLFQGGTPPASPGPDTCGPDAIQEAPDLGCAQGC